MNKYQVERWNLRFQEQEQRLKEAIHVLVAEPEDQNSSIQEWLGDLGRFCEEGRRLQVGAKAKDKKGMVEVLAVTEELRDMVRSLVGFQRRGSEGSAAQNKALMMRSLAYLSKVQPMTPPPSVVKTANPLPKVTTPPTETSPDVALPWEVLDGEE